MLLHRQRQDSASAGGGAYRIYLSGCIYHFKCWMNHLFSCHSCRKTGNNNHTSSLIAFSFGFKSSFILS